MKASTERLVWIGGGLAVLVGGVTALALSSKSSTPQGQGATSSGGGLILPNGVILHIIPPAGIRLPLGGLVFPNGQYQPAPRQPGQNPQPPRQIVNNYANTNGPFSFAMLPGDSLMLDLPTWSLVKDADPNVLIPAPAGKGQYAYVATDNVDMAPNAGLSTDVFFSSGSGWNRQDHRFHVYVGTLV